MYVFNKQFYRVTCLLALCCGFMFSSQFSFAQDAVCGMSHKHAALEKGTEKTTAFCPILNQYFNPISSCDQTFLFNDDYQKHKIRIRLHVLANPPGQVPEYGYQHFTEGQDDQILMDLVDQMNVRLNKTNEQNFYRGGFTYPDLLDANDPNSPVYHNKGYEYVLEAVPNVAEGDQANNGIIYYYPQTPDEYEDFYFCDKLKWNDNPGGNPVPMIAEPCGTQTESSGIASYDMPSVVTNNFVPEAIDVFLVPYHPNYIRYFIDNNIVNQLGDTPIAHTRFTGYANFSNPFNVNAGFYHYRNNPTLFQSGSVWSVETAFSNLVNHETGHNLSLNHPNSGLADIPPHTVTFRCNNSNEHHNTMMDYSCDQTALSPMQRYRIGRKLYDQNPDYLIRDACDKDYNLDLDYTIDQANHRYVFNAEPSINDSPTTRKIWTVCTNDKFIRTAGESLSLNMFQFQAKDIEVSLELYNEVEDCYYSRTEEDFTLSALPIDPSLVSNVSNSAFIENELYEGYNLITSDNWNQVGENYFWEIDPPLAGVYVEDPCANNPTIVLDDSYSVSTEIYLCGTAYTSTNMGPKLCQKICIPNAFDFVYEVTSCDNGSQLIITTDFPDDIIIEGNTIQYWIDNYPNFIDNGNGEYEFNLTTNSAQIQVYVCDQLVETIDLDEECSCELNYTAEILSCESNLTVLLFSTNFSNEIYLEGNTIQYWVDAYPQFEDLGNGDYLFNIVGAGSIDLDVRICDELVEVISIPSDCPCEFTYEYSFTSCDPQGPFTMILVTEFPNDIILEGSTITQWINDYPQFYEDANGDYIFEGLPSADFTFKACGSVQEVMNLPAACEDYLVSNESEKRNDSLIESVKNSNKKFTIYPNPVSDMLTISIFKDDSNFTIYKADGKIVRSINSIQKGQYEFDVSDLENGIYFIKNFDSGHFERLVKL